MPALATLFYAGIICLLGQDPLNLKMPGAVAKVYKTASKTPLKLYVFSPPGHQASDRVPAIIFYFAGSWYDGSADQFEQQCRYFASRGMVAITADYRVASRQKVPGIASVRDAKSSLRWLREHAKELGIDPQRLVAAGDSAGGHIAACAGVIEGLDEKDEDLSVSSRPDAMVLFNPPASFDLQFAQRFDPMIVLLPIWLGANPYDISPAHHVRANQPPTLLVVGSKDMLLPGIKQFHERMQAAGNRCELEVYPDRDHCFFNYDVEPVCGEDFLKTTERVDQFLQSLGYLQCPPTVREFFEK